MDQRYVYSVISEEGLEAELNSVGTIQEFIDVLENIKRTAGAADFERRWAINRRGLLLEALDTLSAAKTLGDGVKTVKDTLSMMNDIKISLGLLIVICIIAAVIGSNTHWGAGVSSAVIMGFLAWYYFPVIRMISNSSRNKNTKIVNKGGQLPITINF